MAFVNGADVITTCRSGGFNNGSLIVMTGGKGDPSPSGRYEKIDPPINHYADSGVAYVRAHRRFFPQFLMVTSGAYDYSNG